MTSFLRARTFSGPRTAHSRRVLPVLALALGCAALGPAILHAALAAAAGSLFEAAPFVLAAELLPRRWQFMAQLGGCGCAGRVPGALSLPATALCWISFGPLIALARLCAGLAVMRFGPARHDVAGTTSAASSSDVFTELLALGPCAAAASVSASALLPIAPHLMKSPLGLLTAFALGMALGIVAPCATAAVAIAGALSPHLAPTAAGVLLTAGLVQIPGAMRFCARPAAVTGAAVAARLGLAVALALLAQRGAAGFVNPRLLTIIELGAGLALLSACRAFPSVQGRRILVPGSIARSWPYGATLVPAILFGALAAGSPVPRQMASATQLGDAYPGEPLSFIATVERSGDGASVLERYEITCCRADAALIAVRLTSRLPLSNGTWIAARGVLTPSPRGLALRLSQWKAITPPADPFVYR